MLNMPEEILVVEKLVFGGYGLCRSKDGVVFVPGVLPGEHVRILPEKKKQGFTTAQLLEIVKSSPSRRVPPCKWSGVCGGCDWLHIEYEAQLKIKREIFLDCMKRIGKIKEELDPEVNGSSEFNYRIRAQIKVDKSGNVGFFKKSTNEIVSIDNCLLLSERLNDLLKVIQTSRVLSHGKIDSLKVIDGGQRIASSPQLADLTEKSTIIKVGDKKFCVRGDSFFQGNRFLLEKLGTWTKPFVGGDTCVDLYGGTGFFSVMLASNFKNGILIESIWDQVESAKVNFFNNGISHFSAMKLFAESCGQVVKESPDLLIVDPPRPGLAKPVREFIAQLKPQKLLYVSCDPSTLARDTGFFVSEAKYKIVKTALFDLYPNTYHMESIVLFER